jgi:DNA-binding XRE family transcriptional regulator
MIFDGRVWKEKHFWLIEIPALDAMTQGRTKSEAFEMLDDLLRTMIDKTPFRVVIGATKGQRFHVEMSQDATVTGLILRRQRAKSGLTVREVAKLLGARSINAYSAYEQGKREPSISKMEELLSVVSKQDKLQVRFG